VLATLRQRDFALLWFGGLISLTGSWVLQVALPFHVYQITGSALAAGAMAIAHTLPAVLLGSPAGVLVDRWDRKRTMVVASLSQGLLLLPLFAVRSTRWIWLVYLVSFAESAISQFFAPAENALLPRLVAGERLVAANSLNALNNSLAMLAGPAIGGSLMGIAGLTGVVILNSASYLVAGVMISLIRRPPGADVGTGKPHGSGAEVLTTTWINLWREWLEGLRTIRMNWPVAGVFVATGAVALGEGILSVLLIPFLELLGGGAREFGWLLTIRGIGGLIGGLVVGHASHWLQPSGLFPLSLAIIGGLGLIMFNLPVLTVALVILFLLGIPAMGAQVSSQTLLQTGVGERYQGRVFGAYGTTVALLLLGGQGLASTLGNHLGTVPMLNANAGLYVLAALIGVYAARR
jgi:MFS family permease